MTTAAMRAIERDAEARRKLAWEDRKAGVDKRRQSLWVITTLRSYLPPEHVTLAHKFARLRALADGSREDREYVDGVGNGVEARLVAAMDALRELYGYEQAALHRVGADGRQCFLAISESCHQSDTARRCGYPVGSTRSLRKLVQLTLLRLHEYEEENIAARNPPMRPGEVRCMEG